MTVSIAPLPRTDLVWLHSIAALYLAELVSDLAPLPLDHFADWWDEAPNGVWQILSDFTRVGLALILQERPGQRELSEFGILPKQRGQGIGRQAAVQCFVRHPGSWMLGVAAALPGTARFCDRVLPGLPVVIGLARGPALTPYQNHSYTFTNLDSL